MCKFRQFLVGFLSPQPLAQISARITAPSPWPSTTLTTLCPLILSSLPHFSVTTSQNVLYKYLPSPRLSSLVPRRGQAPMWHGMWLPDAVPAAVPSKWSIGDLITQVEHREHRAEDYSDTSVLLFRQVGIQNWLRAVRPSNRGSISGRGKGASPLRSIQVGFEGY